jgi:hypothetical protein
MHACTHARVYISCMYTHTHVHTHACMCIYIYTHLYMHVYIIYLYTCMHVCMYTRVCVCVCVYIHTWGGRDERERDERENEGTSIREGRERKGRTIYIYVGRCATAHIPPALMRYLYNSTTQSQCHVAISHFTAPYNTSFKLFARKEAHARKH